MNEKEMNLAILAELKRIANEVFAKVKVSKEGTYTAAELWNEKDAFGESIVIDYKGTESEIYTAEIGTFKMQITPQKLWYVLWKFEKLCNVRQADKIRFTYGEAEHEIVDEKAMYYTGSMERGSYNHETGCNEVIGNGNYKVVTRKKSLKKLSDNVAVDKKERTYYKYGDVWYIISDRPLPENITDKIKNEPDYLFGLLEKYDFSYKWELTAIYKALFEALKSERANSQPEQRKSGNDAENTVICDENNARIIKLSENIGKDEESRVYVRIKNTWHRLVGFGGHDAKSISEKGASELLYLKSILEEMKRGESGICEQNDKILSMLSENYPPEPYNKEKSENVARLATFKTRNVATSYERFQERTICGRFQKNMCPNYLRKKVFPTESFHSRRKISRFKPRRFVGRTNHHIYEENFLERKINVNTGVYMALIRGETKNNILICR